MVTRTCGSGGASERADAGDRKLRLIGWIAAAIALTTLQTLPALAAERGRQAPRAAHVNRANGRIAAAPRFRAPVARARAAFAPVARNRVFFNGGARVPRAVPNIRPSNFAQRPLGGMAAYPRARAYAAYAAPVGAPAAYISVTTAPAAIATVPAYGGFGYLYDGAMAAPYAGLGAWQMNDYAQLSEPQMRDQQNAMIEATSGPIDDPQVWDDGAVSGSVTPVREGQTADGHVCREFRQMITVDGQTEEGIGTACQDDNGSWQVVGGDSEDADADDASAPQLAPQIAVQPAVQPDAQPNAQPPRSDWHDPRG